MGDELIEQVGNLVCIVTLAFTVAYFFQGTMYESVLGVHDGSFRVGLHFLLQSSSGIVAMHENLFLVGQFGNNLFRLGIVLQQFDGQIARRELPAQLVVLLQVFLHVLDTVLNLVSVVDVDVPDGMLFELSLVYLDNGVEQLADAPSVLENRGHHGESQQFAQLC